MSSPCLPSFSLEILHMVRSKKTSGSILMLVIVFIGALATLGLLYQQINQWNALFDQEHIQDIQAQSLAETGAQEGLWFIKNVSENFTGISEPQLLGQGGYQFQIIDDNTIEGIGFVGGTSTANAKVIRYVVLSSNVSLRSWSTQNMESQNFSLWIGSGTTLSWPNSLTIKGGSVYCERTVTFSSLSSPLIERSIAVFGSGVTVSFSSESLTPPARQILSLSHAISLNHDVNHLFTHANQLHLASHEISGTSDAPFSFSGILCVHGNIQIGGVFSGNMVVVAGHSDPGFGRITILDSLLPSKPKDSLYLIAEHGIVIENTNPLVIYAGLMSMDSLTVNVSNSLTINGFVGIKNNLSILENTSLNIMYDPRFFIPRFGKALTTNMAVPYWKIR